GCTRTAAQQQARTPIALIGITREIAPVEARLKPASVTEIQGIVFTSGTIDGVPVVTARAGAGKVNAAFAATLLVDHFSPAALILGGTGGGVDKKWRRGDGVAGRGAGYYD